MNKANILQEIRKELLTLIGTLNTYNVEEVCEEAKKYFRILETVHQLKNSDSNHPVGELQIRNNIPAFRENVAPKQVLPEECAEGALIRKIQGGEIENTKIYVPEKIIREIGAVEGDILSAKLVDVRRTPSGPRNIYQYDLVRRGEKPANSDRRMASFVKVEGEEFGRDLFVTITAEDGSRKRITLLESMQAGLNLDIGDIVDFAYLKDEPEKGKVVWKHPNDLVITETPKVEEGFAEDEDNLPIFNHAKIAIVGNARMHHDYGIAIRESRGEALFFVGDESEDRMANELQEASIILVFPESVGFRGLNVVRSTAEEVKIPLYYVRHMDVKPLLQVIREHL